jgi:hypothetical protein
MVVMARALAFAAFMGTIDVTEIEAELLRVVLASSGDDACELLDGLPRFDQEDALPYIATAVLALGHQSVAPPYAADAVAARVIADEPAGPIGLWGVWRLPLLGSINSFPKRMYLVQASADTPGVAYRVQEALSAAGESDPVVEVFDSTTDLPEFSRRALSRAELLWVGRDRRQVRFASIFDTVDDMSRPIVLDRPSLDAAETKLVASYLNEGFSVRTCLDPVADVLDPARGEVVPVGLRGDGRWIWSEATAYYLCVHGIAPEPALLATIRAVGYVMPEIDAVALHQSRNALGSGVRDMLH